MSDESETILGKRILVGLTYLDRKGNIDRQIQLHGPITRLTGSTLYFERSDGGGEFSIPFDGELDTTDSEAIYTLKSSGEVVENVHFLSTWTIHPPKDER